MPGNWSDRYEKLVADKTRDASAAALPPYVTVAAAPPRDAIAIGNAWSERVFDGPFFVSPRAPLRPSCSLVFVQSADGNTGGDPGSIGGGATDKHLIYEGLSRVAADGVMSGAETVRSGNIVLSVWHPQLVSLRASLGKPRHPAQIVATVRGVDLDRGLLYNFPAVPVILLTVADTAARMHAAIAARPWIQVVTMTGPDDLAGALAQLRARGLERISCIGGRTLARVLLDKGLVDDVYLTTAPTEGGEPHTPIHDKAWGSETIVRKRGTGVEEGVRFDHIHRPVVRAGV